MYNYLKEAKSPKLIAEAMNHYGIQEIVGKEHNPIILGWAKELGLQNVYKTDEIPWCGLFVAIVCKNAGKDVVNAPLWALNWAKWGTGVINPMLGDIVTFKRNSGGHVGFYVGEDDTCYHVLGGNQSNKVCVTRIQKSRLYKARRPVWKIAQPAAVQRIFLDAKGVVSQNEQ